MLGRPCSKGEVAEQSLAANVWVILLPASVIRTQSPEGKLQSQFSCSRCISATVSETAATIPLTPFHQPYSVATLLSSIFHLFTFLGYPGRCDCLTRDCCTLPWMVGSTKRIQRNRKHWWERKIKCTKAPPISEAELREETCALEPLCRRLRATGSCEHFRVVLCPCGFTQVLTPIRELGAKV